MDAAIVGVAVSAISGVFAETAAAAGGAREVRGAADLSEVLASWLGGGADHDYAARRALGYIHGHLGAAARTAALLDELT